MAVPIHFRETNFVLGPVDDQAGGAIPVPVLRLEDGRLVSCWHLSPEELAQVAKTGRVWLELTAGDGLAMPAVFVTANKQDLAA